MSDDLLQLTPNQLALIALANEYCEALEQSSESASARALAERLLRLLTRVYVCALDLDPTSETDEPYMAGALTEAAYDQLRQTLAGIFGSDDVYLEVFEEDMRYSDTPISASLSEGLADLYQEFYDALHWLADATTADQLSVLSVLRGHFAAYWGQTLVNLLRPLHALAMGGGEGDYFDNMN